MAGMLTWWFPLLYAQEHQPSVDREPAVAGSFYPNSKSELTRTLEYLFEEAEPIEVEGKMQTLIVPHAGYVYSGIVAASGYKSIPADAFYNNIFIIASSHREQFNGVSVYAAGDYLTPLGRAKVNREIADKLIGENRKVSYIKRAHEREHSIEVQIPYIQHYFKDPPPIIPILLGSSSVTLARDLAKALLPYFTPENLFIISSDFSHYPVYSEAVRIDGLTAEAILKNDPEGFYNTLRKNSNAPVQNLATPCCGWSSILTMLYMSDNNEDLKISPVLYRNSGDVSIGEKNRVVGYWAIAGHRIRNETNNYLNGDDRQALLDISRTTLESYINQNQIPVVSDKGLGKFVKEPAGAFVSLYMGGKLRGCIGRFLAKKPLYLVVQEMTIASATRDTRFVPVESSELAYISIELSVLTPLQKVEGIDEIVLGRHGIYMTRGARSGTYLPQVAVQTGWSLEEFLGHCAREKAGIGWDGWKSADLYVFEAIVFGEEKGI